MNRTRFIQGLNSNIELSDKERKRHFQKRNYLTEHRGSLSGMQRKFVFCWAESEQVIFL